MLTVTSAQLDAWIAAFFFPLVRVLAFFAAAPVLNSVGMPLRLRLGAGMVVALALAPMVPPLPPIAPGSWAGLWVMAQQVFIGLAMGLAMRVVFAAVDVAGEMIGLQMGLSFAVFFDPQSAGQSSTLAEFLGLLATLVFLALNGHLMMLSMLAETFRMLPIGADIAADGALRMLVAWGATAFSAGVLLALPVVAALLITNIALGVATRAAPQLNLFAVGFPVTLLVGFGVLFIALPYFAPLFERLFEDGIDAMANFVRIAGAPR